MFFKKHLLFSKFFTADFFFLLTGVYLAKSSCPSSRATFSQKSPWLTFRFTGVFAQIFHGSKIKVSREKKNNVDINCQLLPKCNATWSPCVYQGKSTHLKQEQDISNYFRYSLLKISRFFPTLTFLSMTASLNIFLFSAFSKANRSMVMGFPLIDITKKCNNKKVHHLSFVKKSHLGQAGIRTILLMPKFVVI